VLFDRQASEHRVGHWYSEQGREVREEEKTQSQVCSALAWRTQKHKERDIKYGQDSSRSTCVKTKVEMFLIPGIDQDSGDQKPRKNEKEIYSSSPEPRNPIQETNGTVQDTQTRRPIQPVQENHHQNCHSTQRIQLRHMLPDNCVWCRWKAQRPLLKADVWCPIRA
jgi:hypothetical protein